MSPRYVVIGAGISGLTLAWHLKKQHRSSVVLLEGSGRAGGWIRSQHHQGYLFEEGPRSCRTRGAGLATLELVEELGLSSEVIAASQHAKQRFLYAGGKLQKVPNTLWTALTSPLTHGILPALWNDLKAPKGTSDDESIADFISRRLSPSIASRLMDPLVAGIYAGDIQKLSLKSCFPDIYMMERKYGSLVKAMFCSKGSVSVVQSAFVRSMMKEPIFTFRNGMETLVHALEEKLEEEIVVSCEVERLNILEECIEVKANDSRTWQADKVFLGVPGNVACKLLQPLGIADMDFPAASVAVVNMGWQRKVLPCEGFGYLVPSEEREDILGVVWDSSAFPQQNGWQDQTRLTVMMGGSHHPEAVCLSEGQMLDTACAALKKHLGIGAPPDVVHVNVAREAIPQYTVGHAARVATLENAVERSSGGRIQLIGSAWHGVSVNDCIAGAARIAS